MLPSVVQDAQRLLITRAHASHERRIISGGEPYRPRACVHERARGRDILLNVHGSRRFPALVDPQIRGLADVAVLIKGKSWRSSFEVGAPISRLPVSASYAGRGRWAFVATILAPE